jgi:hypothetical protein
MLTPCRYAFSLSHSHVAVHAIAPTDTQVRGPNGSKASLIRNSLDSPLSHPVASVSLKAFRTGD